MKLICILEIVACKFDKETKGSGRWEEGKEEIGRVVAKSSLSLYKLQILGGKPLGNLLISFNAIFRKIYAGPGEARLVEKVGRANDSGVGMNFLSEGCWYTLVV